MTRLLIRRDGDNDWRTPEVTAYDSEAALQRLLAESPRLLPGIEEGAVVTAREFPVLDTGHADLVVVDPEGQITIVECKLQRSSEIKRRVVGQVFAYAAGLSSMTYEQFDQAIAESTQRPLAHHLADHVDEDDLDEQSLPSVISENLAAGRFRLIIAVDGITPELQRVVRYINQHTTDDVELLSIELRYIRHSDVEILTPQVYGEESAEPKRYRQRPRRWSEQELFDRFHESLSETGYEAVSQFRDLLRARGARYLSGAAQQPSGTFTLPLGKRHQRLVNFHTAGMLWGEEHSDHCVIRVESLKDRVSDEVYSAFRRRLNEHPDLRRQLERADESGHSMHLSIEDVLVRPGVLEALQTAFTQLVAGDDIE